MAYSLEEYYDTGDDTFISSIDSSTWDAMTFTAASSYTITRVSLLIYRGASAPTNVIASIRATTAGLPSGADLCDGSVAGSTLTENAAGTWIDFDLGAGTALTDTVKYAICLRTDGANSINWRVDNSSPSYAGGNSCSDSSSGTSWTTKTYDCMFRNYSGSGVTYSELSGTIAATSTVGPSSLGSTTVGIDVKTNYVKRMVVAGNDEIWYEDI